MCSFGCTLLECIVLCEDDWREPDSPSTTAATHRHMSSADERERAQVLCCRCDADGSQSRHLACDCGDTRISRA